MDVMLRCWWGLWWRWVDDAPPLVCSIWVWTRCMLPLPLPPPPAAPMMQPRVPCESKLSIDRCTFLDEGRGLVQGQPDLPRVEPGGALPAGHGEAGEPGHLRRAQRPVRGLSTPGPQAPDTSSTQNEEEESSRQGRRRGRGRGPDGRGPRHAAPGPKGIPGPPGPAVRGSPRTRRGSAGHRRGTRASSRSPGARASSWGRSAPSSGTRWTSRTRCPTGSSTAGRTTASRRSRSASRRTRSRRAGGSNRQRVPPLQRKPQRALAGEVEGERPGTWRVPGKEELQRHPSTPRRWSHWGSSGGSWPWPQRRPRPRPRPRAGHRRASRRQSWGWCSGGWPPPGTSRLRAAPAGRSGGSGPRTRRGSASWTRPRSAGSTCQKPFSFSGKRGWGTGPTGSSCGTGTAAGSAARSCWSSRSSGE